MTKYLGVDYGTKRVGVAVSDERGAIAFPRVMLPNDAELLPRLLRMLEDERVERIVMGDTRTAGGMENPVTPGADRFARELGRRADMPVERAFEVWSSIEAGRGAEERGHDDAAAAAFILQRFLDMQRGDIQ